MTQRKGFGGFGEFGFVRAAAPKVSVSQSLAASGGTLSILRGVEGNFAAGAFDETIRVPRGHLFFPHVCGLLLATPMVDVGVVGMVQFGIPSDTDLYVLATTVTIVEEWTSEEWFVRDESQRGEGVSALSAGLAASGLLTQAFGYFYFRGLLVKK